MCCKSHRGEDLGGAERTLHRVRLAVDDEEIGAHGAVRMRAALLPIADARRREAVALGEFVLRQLEPPPQPRHVDLGRHMDALGLGIGLAARDRARFLGRGDQPLPQLAHFLLLPLNSATFARTLRR